MNYTGTYKIISIHTILPATAEDEKEGLKEAWLTPEEYVKTMSSGDPHEDAELNMVAYGRLLVEEGGKLYDLIAIPDGVSKEDIDAAVAQGSKVYDEKYLLADPEDFKEWEMRGDDFYTKTGIQGTILGEETDPWIKSNQDDGTIILGEFVQIKYEKI